MSLTDLVEVRHLDTGRLLGVCKRISLPLHSPPYFYRHRRPSAVVQPCYEPPQVAAYPTSMFHVETFHWGGGPLQRGRARWEVYLAESAETAADLPGFKPVPGWREQPA